MQRFRFPLAVAATSLALVLGLVVVGGLVTTSVLAGGPPWGGGWRGGPPWAGGYGADFVLPAELASLRDVPHDQRFSHFTGARIGLTDRDGRPVTVEATPGTVSTASATSLTIAANDGSTRTYTLDDQTIRRGNQKPSQNDKVVVVTINGRSYAHAVMTIPPDGFGHRGGPYGWRS